MLTIGSLFSGIGGLELGLERAGLGPVRWQVEIDPFCRGVLAKHWPDAVRFGDVRTVGATSLAAVDLICGGFPCQDLSAANTGGVGLEGARSGLWFEYERIIEEIRPAWIVIENVNHTWRRWVPFVRSALHGLGYASVPFRVRASDFGAPHERARVLIIAHTDARLLRQQSGWGSRKRGARSPISADAPAQQQSEPEHARGAGVAPDVVGERARPAKAGRKARPGSAADAHDPREQQPSRGVAEVRRWARDVSWWDAEPDVVRVVHGLSARVDRRCRVAREAALGNAVVPYVAEAVGRLILGMLPESRRGR